ncbi:hypothetical protein HMPREF0063_10813 [Aeromicrobium marinum DSM 15272]|uniref:HNH nuclease domain-containing protein n=1 Tax=Aeromicrobium marinum DSM 15272 TaxID=585531 RepID=E2SA23_9ACTN|nr:DUF222 domain-containing protein [Aeromicrobium marinum]EFQ84097.1 hypothetical protein HMPREF0063_10813 [Aeromicrobium marinum DSM 15272]
MFETLSQLPASCGAVEPWQLSDGEVEVMTREVQRARAALDAVTVRLAEAAETRGLARAGGHTSTTAWLAATTGLGKREAAALVALSRLAPGECERTRAAWAAGDLSTTQAGTILRAVDQLPDWIDADPRHAAEDVLLEHAPALPADDLRRLANRIIEVIDPDGADEILGRQLEAQERRAYDCTRLRFLIAGHGMTRIQGQLPDAQAQMLRTALEGLAAPRRQRDGLPADDHPHEAATRRPADQRLGHAFCELIEHLPTGAVATAGGLAATVTVNIDLKNLTDRVATATLSTGDQMSAAQTRRFACNAQLIPLVLDGSSRILDHGLAKRLHDRYQRIALAKRDGGCSWKGCDRPPAWCEAHHLTPFSQGGETSVDNGALFCFVHHHLLHDDDWSARLAPDGVVEVIPPSRIDPQRRPLRHTRHLKLRPRAA